MLTEEIRELHFDTYEERLEHINIYERMGWKILRQGCENDWFFKCRKVYKSNDIK